MTIVQRVAEFFCRFARAPKAGVSTGRKPSDVKEAIARSNGNRTRMAMQSLTSSLKSGKITSQEYQAKVAQLDGRSP